MTRLTSLSGISSALACVGVWDVVLGAVAIGVLLLVLLKIWVGVLVYVTGGVLLLLEEVVVWIDKGDGFRAGVAIRDAMLYSSSNGC